MLKIDHATSIHPRGRFARICIEIDLTKKLVPRISIFGTILNIEYEGLHLICFNCSKYGHLSNSCLEPSEMVESSQGGLVTEEKGQRQANLNPKIAGQFNETQGNQSHPDIKKYNQEAPQFGSWMMKKYEKKVPNNKRPYIEKEDFSKLEKKDYVQDNNNRKGSRFDILAEEIMEDTVVQENHMESSSKKIMLVGPTISKLESQKNNWPPQIPPKNVMKSRMEKICRVPKKDML
ncbi:hypothetical protein Ahy_A02g008796 [Arachis hypogaea]|uniref:CCHC-type domain-containing protein n=1 Tax=Arachis hypogaea TaxID=3818 RepID=A0A445EF73_ARAHY|nr:hypothetical protein Ahy_A02g008796 [Arachis hypogaea]